MRHFLAVSLLASRVRESAVTARLVLPARLPQRLCPSRLTAADRAVSIAAIAWHADEKHPLTLGPATNHEAKRVHVPGRRRREIGRAHAAVRRPISSDTSPWIDTRDSELAPSESLLPRESAVPRYPDPLDPANFLILTPAARLGPAGLRRSPRLANAPSARRSVAPSGSHDRLLLLRWRHGPHPVLRHPAWGGYTPTGHIKVNYHLGPTSFAVPRGRPPRPPRGKTRTRRARSWVLASRPVARQPDRCLPFRLETRRSAANRWRRVTRRP